MGQGWPLSTARAHIPATPLPPPVRYEPDSLPANMSGVDLDSSTEGHSQRSLQGPSLSPIFNLRMPQAQRAASNSPALLGLAGADQHVQPFADTRLAAPAAAACVAGVVDASPAAIGSLQFRSSLPRAMPLSNLIGPSVNAGFAALPYGLCQAGRQTSAPVTAEEASQQARWVGRSSSLDHRRQSAMTLGIQASQQAAWQQRASHAEAAGRDVGAGLAGQRVAGNAPADLAATEIAISGAQPLHSVAEAIPGDASGKGPRTQLGNGVQGQTCSSLARSYGTERTSAAASQGSLFAMDDMTSSGVWPAGWSPHQRPALQASGMRLTAGVLDGAGRNGESIVENLPDLKPLCFCFW